MKNVKRINLEEVSVGGNTLILGSSAEQFLLNALLTKSFGKKCIIIDFNEYLADIVKSYDLSINIEHIGEFLKEKLGVFNDEELTLIKIGEYIRYFLRTNLPIMFFKDFLKDNMKKIYRYVGIFSSERYFYEAYYIVELLNLLLNLNVKPAVKSEKGDLLLSFKLIPLSLKRLTFVLLVDYLSEAVRDIIVIIPFNVFGVFSREEYTGTLMPSLSKILLRNKLVIIGNAIPYPRMDFLLKIDTLIIAGKVFQDDLNFLLWLFPQLNYVREFIGEYVVVISSNGTFIVEDATGTLHCEQSIALNYAFEEENYKALILNILKLLSEKPLAKNDMLTYLAMNLEREKIASVLDQVIARKLAVEYVGVDGEYWLKITPLGRYFLDKGDNLA